MTCYCLSGSSWKFSQNWEASYGRSRTNYWQKPETRQLYHWNCSQGRHIGSDDIYGGEGGMCHRYQYFHVCSTTTDWHSSSNICLIGQISHNRSNIWKIIKIFSNVWESFQIMLFFLVVMGPQIILLLISTLQQPKLAGKGRQKSWKRRSANVSQSLKRSLLSNFMYVG